MGGCYASRTAEQEHLADRIDAGLWPLALPDPETSLPAPDDAARQALGRVVRHAPTLVARMAAATGGDPVRLDLALRTALQQLLPDAANSAVAAAPPPGTAAGLRYLRDRISVPRDMDLHAARHLRAALEATAGRDPADPGAQGPPLPVQHRRDQDPAPFARHD
jgi:glutathione S-transferase